MALSGTAREAEDRQSRAGREAGGCTPLDSSPGAWRPHAAGQVRPQAVAGAGAPRYPGQGARAAQPAGAGRAAAGAPRVPLPAPCPQRAARVPGAGAGEAAGRGRYRGPTDWLRLAGGGHAFGCGRAGFGPGPPWQPLAGSSPRRPPAAAGERGAARCAQAD